MKTVVKETKLTDWCHGEILADIFLILWRLSLHFSFLGFPPYCSSFQVTTCLVLHNPANITASLWLLFRRRVTDLTRWITALADWCFTSDCGVTVGFTLSWWPLHRAVRTSVHQARVRCRPCWLHTHMLGALRVTGVGCFCFFEQTPSFIRNVV